MADDWQVGDLALCVGIFDPNTSERVHGPCQTLPIVGLGYTVTAVRSGVDVYGNQGTGLTFAEIRNSHPHAVGWNSEMFRKIRPQQPDAEDAETIRLLTGAPARQPEGV